MCWCNPSIRCDKPDCHPDTTNRPDIKAEIIEEVVNAFNTALLLDSLDLDYAFENDRFKVKIEIEEK